MLHTPLCDLLGLEYPIIQAGMGDFISGELTAAVSNAGGLGTLSRGRDSIEEFPQHLALTKELTSRPFAINHLVPTLNEDTFALTLEARPTAVSFALGDPGDLVKRVQDSGILVIQQVHTVRQAFQAAERGVDVIIAQGSEAGGFAGTVAALALVPQVVDAVRPIPVVAAGGIGDGRGLAAALGLGAQGVNIGTRCLASAEASCGEGWKQAILAAQSEDAIIADVFNDIIPLPGTGGYGTVPRAIRTPFIEKWQGDRDGAREHAGELRVQVRAAIPEARFHEFVPFAGQTVGMINDVLPAGEIVRKMAAEAEAALERANLIRS